VSWPESEPEHEKRRVCAGTGGPGRLVLQAQEFVAAALGPGDWALDATVGTGKDTLFLARRVGPLGRVYGFDVQQQALDIARDLLFSAGQAEQTRLLRADHSRMAGYLPLLDGRQFRAMMMNLGYLPGGDSRFRTRTGSTLAALYTMLEHLGPGGHMTVLAYRGHPGGAEETHAVQAWTSTLVAEGHGVRLCDPAPGRRPPPLLVLIEKAAEDRRRTGASPGTVFSGTG